ncbi:MAG: hypothetical protein COY66_01875 [Candidatus Kerfeldbacteria bacterium CG_4_10_14_0_8_um_filter_42_10]|uniref:Cytochrome b5 heme-binding domain-containing protein n=1 Tax=Candidatus Kerfeldbacteria bacterium CG_4_10_14_0_8_um_filter_42_10 TaxID=2014248 RepID=A0A2M7RKK1_9BACT|nr:MAG: hypothetical protein COY66_01875 [Candidatus Kerfeldbacteria bacterium CG_4_10_14_0_8_um_filter_42_10]
MKTENKLGIIGMIVVAFLVAYFSYTYQNRQLPSTNAVNSVYVAPGSDSAALTEAKIAQHSTREDCWLIIENKVYDVTNYLKLHPGGQDIVLPYCGKDATQAFNTKAGQGSHSQSALEQLGALYLGNLNQNAVTTETANNNTNAVATDTVTVTQTDVVLSATMAAQHDNRNDCWLIINSGVYDVTNYLTLHPGGSSIIIPYCGKDATQAFNTQAGQGSHSSFAQSQLANYLIGALGSTTTPNDLQQNQQIINQVPPPATGDDDEEEDDEEEEEDESEEEDD